MILISLVAGRSAYLATSRDTLLEWESGHFPPLLVWQESLGALRFQPIRDTQKLQKVFRAIQVSSDAPGSIWTSDDSKWVAVYLSAEEAIPIHAFCADCEAPVPRSWKPAGRGWGGFADLLELARKTAVSKPKPARVAVADPREIRY